jgi:hypothetical protein
MALLGALLTTVHDEKPDSSQYRALPNNLTPQTLQVPSRGIRHVPTNSECDRLAKTLEGLDLSKEAKNDQANPKPQSVAASDADVGAFQPPPKGPPSSSSSFAAMYEKIKESLKSPLTLSSRPKSTTSTTPTPSIVNMVKSESDAVPHTPPSPSPPTVKGDPQRPFPPQGDMQHGYPSRPGGAMYTQPRPDWKGYPQNPQHLMQSSSPVMAVQGPVSADKIGAQAVRLSSTVHSTVSSTPPPANISQPEPAAQSLGPQKENLASFSDATETQFPAQQPLCLHAEKVGCAEVGSPSSHPQALGNLDTATSESESVVQQRNVDKMETEFGLAPLLVTATSVASALTSETPKTPTTTAPAQVSEKATPLLQNVNNKDLKGVPGLKASKWASEPDVQRPVPSTRQSTIAEAKPIYPIPHPHPHGFASPQIPHFLPGYAPPQTPGFMPQGFGNVFASPPPAHLTMAGPPPVLQTVLVGDPLRPGMYHQVTGFATPPPMTQENVPYSQQSRPSSNVPPQANKYAGHKSNEYPESDMTFSSRDQAVTPSRSRGVNALSPQSRTALSPVRQGEDVQAKFQSRLNSSLAGRSPNGHDE